jgi:hypothetical protein
MAAEAIEKDYKNGEAGKLTRDQLQRILPKLQKQFHVQTCRAFDRVIFAGGASYPIEEKYQVSEDMIMQRAQGQACLRKYLEEKKLIYLAGDAIDVGRFVKEILPGATPLADKPGVYTAKAIHERFLSAPGVRLIPDGAVIRQTLLKSVREGKIVIRLVDVGRAYDKNGCVEGPEGRHRRMPGELTTLSLDESVQITLSGTDTAALWIKEDKPGIKPTPGGTKETPLPPSETKVRASTWAKAEEYAKERPLLKLELIAHTPVEAQSLLPLAQPFGSESISLSVDVRGNLKDGGKTYFLMEDVKPTHGLKPLEIAQRLYTATSEGATYEAILVLSFGASGRTGLEAQFRKASEGAPDGIALNADFDKPTGGRS